MQWEYDTIEVEPGFWTRMVNPQGIRTLLNQKGKQGWELVNAFDTNYGQGGTVQVVLIFKRPLAEQQPQPVQRIVRAVPS